ncbi:MAG: helix-turn-helix domain-containing protein [Bacteroidota bacterium]
MNDLFEKTITFGQSIHLILLSLIAYVIIQVISHRKTNLRSNGILLFLLLQFLLIISVSALMAFEHIQIAKFLLFLFIPPVAFIAPTCYLYVNSLTNYTFYLNKKIAKHFILPVSILFIGFIINMVFVYFYYSKPGGNIFEITKAVLKYFMVLTMYLLIFPQLIFYSILSFISYKKHLKEIQLYFSNLEEVRLQWLRFFIIGFSLFVVFYIISNSDILFNQTIRDIIYYGVKIFFIAFIGLFGAKQVDIYSRFSSEEDFDLSKPSNQLDLSIDNLVEQDVVTNENQEIDKKPSESFFSNDIKKDELKNSLIQLIEVKKPYIKDSLTIEDLSTALSTNKKYLSYIINEYFDKNFYNFINEYRINDAISLLSDPKSQFYSIEGIGNLVGFKSKSSFYTAFKKVTGKTPFEYKQDIGKK